jgi:hypothetical protein
MIKISPGDRVPLQLTAPERKSVLKDLPRLEPELRLIIEAPPKGKPIQLTLDDVEWLQDHIVDILRSTGIDYRLQDRMVVILEKLNELLATYDDSLGLNFFNGEEDRETADASPRDEPISAAASAIEPGVHLRGARGFTFSREQGEILATLTMLSGYLKQKLRQGIELSGLEVSAMAVAMGMELSRASPARRRQLTEILVDLKQRVAPNDQMTADESNVPPPPKKTGVYYQFKITLKHTKPPIWRRIAIEDGPLDDLHFFIQSSMGWTDSHLHQFVIDREFYGDPELLNDGAIQDSMEILLSEIFQTKKKGYKFRYDYDFGDNWQHEVVFEGEFPQQKGVEYPLCLAGKRACPPEDIGGVWGYASLLEALADPDHEMHDDMELPNDFEPEAFSVEETTESMRNYIEEWPHR